MAAHPRSATVDAGVASARSRGDQCLIRRHRDGETRARETMIVRYLPLARRLALRYRRTSAPADDLVQVASLGLVKAVDRWDPDRGIAFASFAAPTILGELRHHLRDATWHVRPPRRLQELSLTLERAREQLASKSGREPTVAELAGYLGRPCDEVSGALDAAAGRSLPSLGTPVHDAEGQWGTVGEVIGTDDPEYERVEARVTLERMTSVLDHRAREIVRLRFEHDLRQREIARRVGVSQMQVSRILRASIEQLGAA